MPSSGRHGRACLLPWSSETRSTAPNPKSLPTNSRIDTNYADTKKRFTLGVFYRLSVFDVRPDLGSDRRSSQGQC